MGMFKTFGNAFKTPDLRNKLIFTLFIMVLFRLGSFLPTPGISLQGLDKALKNSSSGDLLGLLNLFSGGGLMKLSVFALGIMPYITASIIIQLLKVAVPKLEALYKEGDQTKITQYTRYLTIGLAILQSTTIITTARNGLLYGNRSNQATTETNDGSQIVPNSSVFMLIMMILCMTAGCGLIMWLAELITEKGVGNGMSLLIFTSIVSGFPSSLWSVKGGTNGIRNFAIIVLTLIAIIFVIVFVEQSQRRIPVQYAKRMVGQGSYGGNSTYIPIKINMSGVIPVIFSSSILSMPAMAAQFTSKDKGWGLWVQTHMNSASPIYIILDSILIIAFCFFYVSIVFDPVEVSDNIKKYNGFIPGIRAGESTADYLKYVLNRINTPGSIYLMFVALIPTLIIVLLNIQTNLPFGGTSLLIIVGVALDTVKQIDSQLQQRHYGGFLR
jgi:preprotein translocase subunit SecY